MPDIAPVIIKPSNRDRIEARLRIAREPAHVRILDYDQLAALCAELEARLEPLPKAQRAGATAYVRAGHVVSWHYTTAEEDMIRLVRRSGGWAVVGLERTPCGTGLAYSSRSKLVSIELSAHQFGAWAERLGRSRRITVQDCSGVGCTD